jgi:hypothetical protein
VVAERACWDVVWAAANPTGLYTPSSHMVSRALVLTVLKMQDGEQHAVWWP